MTSTSIGLITIEIGGMPIELLTSDRGFARTIEERYSGFVVERVSGVLKFDVEVVDPSEHDADHDLEVAKDGSAWKIRRGDFTAEFDPSRRTGRIRQAASPYALDSVLRVAHSLLLAEEGGFLVHAASAIRNGKAFLFSGISGAGKTTISRLAPPDATLLTDEVSYVRREGHQYRAYGTPFAGELARLGENCSAPLETLYILCQGPGNRIDPIERSEALRLLLRNILFFAHDSRVVRQVFESAWEFVERVPVRRLTFLPEPSVWELVG